jgi:hypothetical protein
MWCVVTGAPNRTRMAVRRGVAASAVRRRERNAGYSVSAVVVVARTCGSTYHNGAVDAALDLARGVLLLVARLLLLQLRSAPRRWEADGDIGNLQDAERKQGAEQRGDRVGDNVAELEGVERENEDRVQVRVQAGHVVGQRLDGRCGRPGLSDGRGVDDSRVGHCERWSRRGALRRGANLWWDQGVFGARPGSGQGQRVGRCSLLC